jgi:hypothetical protein
VPTSNAGRTHARARFVVMIVSVAADVTAPLDDERGFAELGGDAFGQYRAGEPRADDQEVIFHLRKLKTESGETDN